MPRAILILITSLAALLASLTCAAQSILPQLKRETPDMEQIRREINDRSSQYYYPRLMKEYERNDTLMKIDKFRRLYLGYMLQEDFDPYRPGPEQPDLGAMLKPGQKLTRAQCDTIIYHTRRALADNPFNLRQITLLIQALRDKNDINLAKIWQYKLNYLLMAIVSTGEGSDEEDAWWVTEPQHEYVLLNMMGFKAVGHEFIEPGYELIHVEDRQGRKSSFYFNINSMLGEYFRKHPEEAPEEDEASPIPDSD